MAKLASSITFIVLASFTIVTYDRQNMFIIQATGLASKYETRSKKLGTDKRSSLLVKSDNDEDKKVLVQ
jgi:hypothetical protein